MCLKVVSAMLQRCNYEGGLRRRTPTPARLPARPPTTAPPRASLFCTVPKLGSAVLACLQAPCKQQLGLHPRSASAADRWALPQYTPCAVDTRSSGQEALTLLRERQEQHNQFDLVLSDVYMPGEAAAVDSACSRAAAATPCAADSGPPIFCAARSILGRNPPPAVSRTDMDGFKLLEHIGLELDLPVISELLWGGRDGSGWAAASRTPTPERLAAPAASGIAVAACTRMLVPCPIPGMLRTAAAAGQLLPAAAVAAAVMSSNGDTNVVLRGVTHGAVDFLIKASGQAG